MGRKRWPGMRQSPITQAKRTAARMTDIPTTKSGRTRKMKRIAFGGFGGRRSKSADCLVVFALVGLACSSAVIVGCGSSKPSTTAPTDAAALPTKPADQMSDTELIEAYRAYEKEHSWLSSSDSQWYNNKEMALRELGKSPESEVTNIFTRIDAFHRQFLARHETLKAVEGRYARSWNGLGLKLLPPTIHTPNPPTLELVRKDWQQSKDYLLRHESSTRPVKGGQGSLDDIIRRAEEDLERRKKEGSTSPLFDPPKP